MEAVGRSDDGLEQEVTLAPLGDTIFALSSGAPPAAIAIVRVSGPAAAGAMRQIAGKLPPPRRASVAALHDAAGALIDRALLLWMPGPGTATGEDLAEFHVHGGSAVITALLHRLDGIAGLRLAQPGEFTRRAFLNGRIDLTAAEGLAELLAAETAGQHARAMRMTEGGLGRIIERWRGTLLTLSAQIEAHIEYGESDDDVSSTQMDVREPLRLLAKEAEGLLAAPPAERLRDGFRIVVAGPPNSGKSSLVNALAARDVALATPIAGTTRDVIEAPVSIDGQALLLIDTAGLRDGDDEIERLGIDRARQVIDTADLILWCGEAAERPILQRSIQLFTRADERGPVPEGSLRISIAEPDSLIVLRRIIVERSRYMSDGESLFALNIRQRRLVGDIAGEVRLAIEGQDTILQAEHLRICRGMVDQLLGRSGVEEMLDALFGQFCLGK